MAAWIRQNELSLAATERTSQLIQSSDFGTGMGLLSSHLTLTSGHALRRRARMLLLLTSSHVSAGSARPARLVSSLPARLRCESVKGSSWQPPRCTAFSHHHRQVASQCPDDMRWGVTAQHGAPGLPCTQHCGLYTPVCDAAADLYASLLGQVGSLWQTKQAAYDIWASPAATVSAKTALHACRDSASDPTCQKAPVHMSGLRRHWPGSTGNAASAEQAAPRTGGRARSRARCRDRLRRAG